MDTVIHLESLKSEYKGTALRILFCWLIEYYMYMPNIWSSTKVNGDTELCDPFGVSCRQITSTKCK